MNYTDGTYHKKFIFRKATIDDISELAELRTTVLRAANELPDDLDMSYLEHQSYCYYEKALNNSHTAYLVFDNTDIIASGAICYYEVMPTFQNPIGKKAYIMNIYTDPNYRRQGIASKVLDLLIADSLEKGIDSISLETTDMGRPLYEKKGFVKMNDEMKWIKPPK